MSQAPTPSEPQSLRTSVDGGWLLLAKHAVHVGNRGSCCAACGVAALTVPSGLQAAAFLGELRDLIESPELALLDL